MSVKPGARAIRRSVFAAFTATLVATGGLARAEERPAARLVYLRGKGTESCPVETVVREAVQVRLGYDPFSTWAASTMFVEVSATTTGFAATLKLVDGDGAVRGDRLLTVTGRCTELVDAMALTMSLAIDPMSAARDGPTPGLPPVERSVAPTPPDPVASAVATTDQPAPDAADAPPAPPSREPLRLAASLGPLVSVGSAPGIAAGGVLAMQAARGRWLLQVEGRAELPASRAVTPGGRVESSLLAGQIFFGAREGIVFAGVTGALGRLAATSSEVLRSRDQAGVFVGLGFRIGLGIPLGDRLELRAHGEALANLHRHSLTISGAEVYEYPIASGNAGISLAVRFR